MGWLWVSNLSIAIGTLLTTGKKEEVCVEVTVHLPLSVSVASVRTTATHRIDVQE